MNKILLSLSVILLFAVFIGTRASDVIHPDQFVPSNHVENSRQFIGYMAKRRFLPTRRESHKYIPGEFNGAGEEDTSHLNAKRYFLKSKRYFLHSKRSNERREDE